MCSKWSQLLPRQRMPDDDDLEASLGPTSPVEVAPIRGRGLRYLGQISRELTPRVGADFVRDANACDVQGRFWRLTTAVQVNNYDAEALRRRR